MGTGTHIANNKTSYFASFLSQFCGLVAASFMAAIFLFSTVSLALTTRVLETTQHSFKFEISDRILGSGVREVEYTFVLPRALNDYRLPVLIGRDLDLDGRIDTWFPLSTENGPQVIDCEHCQADGDGWAEAQKILLKSNGLGSKPFSQVLYDAIGFYLFFAKDYINNFQSKALNRELTLLSIEVLLDRQKQRPGLTREQRFALVEQYQMLSEQWAEFADEIKFKEIPKQILVTAANGVLLLPFPKLIELLSDGIEASSRFLPSFIEKMWFNSISSISRYSQAFAARTSSLALAIGNSLLGRTATRGATYASSRLVLAQERWLIAKALGNFFGAIWKNQKYIMGASILIQIPAEMAVNFDRLKDPKDPSARKFLSNFVHDPAIQQDLLFMFIETMLQTGILEGGAPSSTIQLLKRVPWASLASTIDSVTVGRLIKGTGDPGRNVIDVLWETVVGVGQTTLDRAVARKAGPLAQAIEVIANQAIGYCAYGTLTKWYERGGGKDWFSKKISEAKIGTKGLMISLDGLPPPPLDPYLPYY